MPTLGNTPRPAYVYDTETDTWVPVGVGAHTHSDIPNTLVDAKGDLITATADNVPARLAKGADGTVLVSDSTTSTGLAWQPYAAQFVAGKNKIINGDFGVWQRGISFTNPAILAYTADRYFTINNGSSPTVVVSQESLLPNTIAGYNGDYYFRYNQTAAGTGASLTFPFAQRIENAKTLAGQTVTFSLWVKSDSARSFTLNMSYNLGTGGSSAPAVSTSATKTSATTWERHTFTTTLPTLSGLTVGAGSFISVYLSAPVNVVQTWDIWGVQLEAGPIATPFTTATGTIQGELAACQRYYWRAGGDVIYEEISTSAVAEGSGILFFIKNPVTMRSAPSSVEWSTLMSYDGVGINAINSGSLSPFSTKNMSRFNATPASAPTSYRSYTLFTNNSTNGYIAFNAEL